MKASRRLAWFILGFTIVTALLLNMTSSVYGETLPEGQHYTWKIEDFKKVNSYIDIGAKWKALDLLAKTGAWTNKDLQVEVIKNYKEDISKVKFNDIDCKSKNLILHQH